jgi:glycosyltransferase involved in cell wall biosynthesis
MSELRDITVLIVNYRTLELTKRCVETLLAHYPEIRLLLIDNGSADASTNYLRELADRLATVDAIFNDRNRYHGPAVDQGIRHCETPYVFTLDSDCEVRQGGFLEAMRGFFRNPLLYAVGELRYKSRYGYTFGYGEGARTGRRRRIPYIHPWGMLLDRDKYLGLAPFIHHGSPCLGNMRDAQARGYQVQDFPMWDYIEHYGRGTSSHHGYGLWAGGKQKLSFYLEKFEGFLFRDPTLDPLGGSKERSQSA